MATFNISTAQDWINLTNNGLVDGGIYYVQNDIDLTQYVVSSINMTQSQSVTFYGKGNALTISQVADDFTGLFANFRGTINDLDVNYTTKLNISYHVDAAVNFGFFIGNYYGNGDIINCSVDLNDDVTVNISTADSAIAYGSFIGTLGESGVLSKTGINCQGNLNVACKISNTSSSNVECNIAGFIGNFTTPTTTSNFNSINYYKNVALNGVAYNSRLNIGGVFGRFTGTGADFNSNSQFSAVFYGCLDMSGNSLNGEENIGGTIGLCDKGQMDFYTLVILGNFAINGSSDSNCGGLIGQSENLNGKIVNSSMSVANNTTIHGSNVGGLVGKGDSYVDNTSALYGDKTILSGTSNLGTFIGLINNSSEEIVLDELFVNTNVLFDSIDFILDDNTKNLTTLVSVGGLTDPGTTPTYTYTNVFATTGNNAIVTGFTNNLASIISRVDSDGNTKYLGPAIQAKYSQSALTDDLVKNLLEKSPNVPTEHKLHVLNSMLSHSNTDSVNVPYLYSKKLLTNTDSSVSDSALIKHLNPAKKLKVKVDDKVYVPQNEGDLYLNNLTRVPFSVDAQKGGAYFGRKFIKVGDDVNVNGFNFKLLGTGSLAVEVSEPSNLGWWFWVLVGILALLTVVLVYYLFIRPKPMYIVIKDFKDL